MLTALCDEGHHVWMVDQMLGHLLCERCGYLTRCRQCLREQGMDVVGMPNDFCSKHQQAGQVASFHWQDVAAHLITLGRAIPVAEWHLSDNPLLHWYLTTLMLGVWRVELAHDRRQDSWRLLVYPVGAAKDAVPVFSATGPARTCRILYAQPGTWVAVVMATEARQREGVPA